MNIPTKRRSIIIIGGVFLLALSFAFITPVAVKTGYLDEGAGGMAVTCVGYNGFPVMRLHILKGDLPEFLAIKIRNGTSEAASCRYDPVRAVLYL